MLGFGLKCSAKIVVANGRLRERKPFQIQRR